MSSTKDPQATKPVDEQIDEMFVFGEHNFESVGDAPFNVLKCKHCDRFASHHLNYAVKSSIQALLTEARIAEWELLLKAKITHGGNPALFNPDGLPISTPATEELTQLVHQLATTRIAQLKNERSNK